MNLRNRLLLVICSIAISCYSGGNTTGQQFDYLGAGVLPVSMHNGKIHMLMGQRIGKTEKDKNKWSDFGGSKNAGETDPKETATREFFEEIDTDQLGLSKEDIIRRIKLTRNSFISEAKHGTARFITYVIPINHVDVKGLRPTREKLAYTWIPLESVRYGVNWEKDLGILRTFAFGIFKNRHIIASAIKSDK